jgi:hypothetical protein
VQDRGVGLPLLLMIHYSNRTSFRVFLVFLGAVAVVIADPIPEATQFVPEKPVPDLDQTDPKAEFPGRGKMYCAPVAVSNSLMAFFGEDLEFDGVTQFDVVKQLASVGYMNTHRKHGTHLNQFVRGVRRYVEEQGVKDFTVRFQGYLKHERALGGGMQRPRLRWIQAHLASGGAAWLSVGWYTYDAETKTYDRTGGHWVTAVGFGVDANGDPDPAMLIVHDPAIAAGKGRSREYVRVTMLEEGTVKGALEHQELRARGLYRLGGGMHIDRKADCALLDGVVGLAVRDWGDE